MSKMSFLELAAESRWDYTPEEIRWSVCFLMATIAQDYINTLRAEESGLGAGDRRNIADAQLRAVAHAFPDIHPDVASVVGGLALDLDAVVEAADVYDDPRKLAWAVVTIERMRAE